MATRTGILQSGVGIGVAKTSTEHITPGSEVYPDAPDAPDLVGDLSMSALGIRCFQRMLSHLLLNIVICQMTMMMALDGAALVSSRVCTQRHVDCRGRLCLDLTLVRGRLYGIRE